MMIQTLKDLTFFFKNSKNDNSLDIVDFEIINNNTITIKLE